MPNELLASTTSVELAEMMAFERIEPFGSLWEDTRFGVLIAQNHNIHRASGSEPIGPADVFSTLRPPPAPEVDLSGLTEAQRNAYWDAKLFGGAL
jgi:hypothetical protein